NAEILNIRPKEILNGFYPQFSIDKNCYTDYNNDYLESITSDYTSASFNCRQDNDIDKTKPLILSVDWGVFMAGVVSQNLPNKYRTLKQFWVKGDHEEDQEDLINNFADYYDALPNKVVHLYYGHDGNAR